MNQNEQAQNLIDEINKDIAELEELTPEFLLDMMGVLGLEFSQGNAASEAFVFSHYEL